MFGMSITSVSSIVTRGGRAAVIADMPYAYYTFDIADVTDTSILNNISTFYDASLSSTGILDGSNNISGTTDLSLNSATSQFVTINSPMDIGKSTGLSILFWVRYGGDVSNGTRIFDFGNNTASDNIETFIDSLGIPNLSIYSGSTQYTYSFGYPLNYNIYKHLGITMSANGTFNYYIDGVLYKTTTGNQYPANVVRTTNYIGKSSNNALFFNGGVGELRIYNNAVSTATIVNVMNTNVRVYINSFMSNFYGFKYTDLQNGLIKNLATDVYDASFLTPVTAFDITSGTGTTSRQIGITTGTQKHNQSSTSSTLTIDSRINSNFLYNLPSQVLTGTAPTGQSVDWNCGIYILNGFTTPSTGGFTVNFWFYTNTNTNTYDLPFFSFNNGNTSVPITKRIAFGVNNSVGTSTSLWVNTVKDATNNKNSITATTNPGSYINKDWHQYSLVVDYNAQTMRSYIDIDVSAIVFNHTYIDYSNTTFNNCTLLNDITYAGFDYNRPIRGFMDNFRIYNVPLRVHELRQLAQVPVIPSSRVYTLQRMSVPAPVNGNVAIYMDNSVNRIYLSAGVGNLYVGNIAGNTWTQSTLAAGSPGQLENRNWRDIVCNGTGQYVVACVRTFMNDPSGVVFYSSDYGSTFTQTASVIDTSFCFNLAMSDDGNYTYMTAWGLSLPPNGSNVNRASGNLFTSLDKGVTWSRITDIPGAGLTAGVSWASMPSQVRCNSTGEYLTLGLWGSTQHPLYLSNYGHTLLTLAPSVSTFGQITSNPVVTNRVSDGALILNAMALSIGSSANYNTQKQVFTVVLKQVIIQACVNAPLFGSPGPPTTGFYPWIGGRNINLAQNRKTVVMVETAGLGNVYVSTNGMGSVPWPEIGTNPYTNCLGDFINLTIPNVISQTAIPRSAWCGLCVNWNDNFAFANKTGTVYLYTWTLQ